MSESIHPDAAGGAASDEQLMLDFARGSEGAFTELFLRYKGPVFGFFRRRLSDPAHAEELTQEVFLAVLVSAERYEITATFRTFLYAIAMRTVRASRRKMIFRAMFHGSAPPGFEPSGRPGAEAEMILREAIGKLAEMDREMLMLREYEGLSYEEIASVLRVPLNTVRSRLFRARRSLQEMLASPAAAGAREQLASAEGHS